MARGKLGYTGSVDDEHAFRRDKKPLCALSGSGFEGGRDVIDGSNVPHLKRYAYRTCRVLPQHVISAVAIEVADPGKLPQLGALSEPVAGFRKCLAALSKTANGRHSLYG